MFIFSINVKTENKNTILNNHVNMEENCATLISLVKYLSGLWVECVTC